MAFSTAPFADRALTVVALGGNALSPPSGDASYTAEREIVSATARELAALVAEGRRLIIVHGNGPQVGRLMRSDLAGGNLDIHVAQTQGELGYLLTQALTSAGVADALCLVTRSVVAADDPELLAPSKAVGPTLPQPPPGQPSRRSGDGWRVLVGSPKPVAVPEFEAIRAASGSSHVIAGGGGGIPVTGTGEPVQGVVDKDRVAALLAIRLEAQALVFATDVDGVFEHFQGPDRRLVPGLDLDDADALLATGTLGAGSMAPKVESALAFARACGRPAHIGPLGAIAAALRGEAGTTIGAVV